ARNVFRQAAAGDMRQSFYHCAVEQAFKRAQITTVRTQQRFADGGVELAQISIRRAIGDFKEKFARQRISVCVQTDRGQGEHDVARRDRTSVDYLFAIDYADDEARDVVFAIGIEAGHLGRLAAKQHANIFPATVRDTFDNAGHSLRRELSGRDVVEKEEWARTLHQNVVR